VQLRTEKLLFLYNGECPLTAMPEVPENDICPQAVELPDVSLPFNISSALCGKLRASQVLAVSDR
jgi:hypothetical protein